MNEKKKELMKQRIILYGLAIPIVAFYLVIHNELKDYEKTVQDAYETWNKIHVMSIRESSDEFDRRIFAEDELVNMSVYYDDVISRKDRAIYELQTKMNFLKLTK